MVERTTKRRIISWDKFLEVIDKYGLSMCRLWNKVSAGPKIHIISIPCFSPVKERIPSGKWFPITKIIGLEEILEIIQDVIRDGTIVDN